MKRFRWLIAVLSVLSIVAAACGGGEADGGDGGDGGTEVELVAFDDAAEGEGALSLIAWPYYTEDDIVTPFEEETGCEVTVKYGNTSDEMVNLMRQQGGSLYDGVSASGDASNRLIANGDVAAIDVSTFPGYENVLPELQAPAHNTVNDIHYGVPYEWGPNILMYRSDLYTTAPTSWSFVFEESSPAWGSLTAYDSPIYIADAALYLKSARPELGITDPYELTQEQFDAAVELLQAQSAGVSKYWAVYTDEIDGFEAGDMTAGTAWPINQGLIKANGNVEVASVLPTEGVTGWADTWMMSSNAPHPVCMAKWMAYTLRDEVQTSTAYIFGATPSTGTACPALEELLGEDAVLYHCGDSDFLGNVAFWKTPLPECGDDRGQVCVDYSEWTNAWTAIRGA